MNIQKNLRRSLPNLSSETSGINNYRKKENSVTSSGKLSFSDNFSVNESSKGIKNYNFNETQTKEKKSKKLILSDIDFSEKKRKENLKNKLMYRTKYLNIFNSNKKQKQDNNKLNNLFYSSKKVYKDTPKNNKYNISILEKFNKDFKKYFLNSLENSKIKIKKNLEKINNTFYKPNRPKNLKLQNNINNNENNSLISEQSQKSFSIISRKSKENYLENKILKTKYSSQLIKNNKEYKRKRNFKQYIDEKKFLDKDWNSKIGIVKSNIEYNYLLSNDIKFQSRVIRDELCLLIDDIQYYRITFIGNNDIYSSFKNMEIKKQIKVNKILEESCALLHYIPKIILKEYYNSTDKFIAIEDPSREMFSKKFVYNELETFQDNLKYLYKISNFVKCCGEVYNQLISQVENEMTISPQNFLMLKEILKRIRFYIINLTNIGKNSLINYCFDKYIIINKCKRAINNKNIDINKIKINTNNALKKIIKKNNKLKKSEKLKKNPTNIINKEKEKENEKEKITNNNNNKNQEIIEMNEELEDIEKKNDISKTFGKTDIYMREKLTRINKALEINHIYERDNFNIEKDKSFEKKKLIEPMACINSKLMTKMLKYINKDIRAQIISLRTAERHINYKID